MKADDTPTTELSILIAEQVRTYRNERRRRRRGRTAPSKNEHRTSENELIIDLARRWRPYGGPPAEEIFQLFGISRPQFIELLWNAVRMVDRNGSLTVELAAAYPLHHPQR